MTKFSCVRLAVWLTVGVPWGLLLSGCATTAGAMPGLAERVEAQQASARQSMAPAGTDDRATHLQLVAQMQQNGLHFASLAHLEALQQRWGADPDSNLLLADGLRQTGQFERARQLYGDLLMSPHRARAEHGLGLLAAKGGGMVTATAHFQRASLAAPTDANILSDLGFALLQQGRLAEARVPLQKAAELATDNAKAWSNLALYLMLDGQPHKAQDVFLRSKLGPTAQAQIAAAAQAIRERIAGAKAIPVQDGTLPGLVLATSFDLNSWQTNPAGADALIKPPVVRPAVVESRTY